MPRLSTFRLTHGSISALPIKDGEYFVWDANLRGFGVRVYPSGGKKYVARAKYLGHSRRCQIGPFGVIPFEEAKKLARKAIADILDGKNPNKQKKSERLSPTVKQLAGRFLEEYVRSHCKPKTRTDYEDVLDRYILPVLGSVKVIALSREDVLGLHSGLRETPYQANKTLSILQKMLNQAEVWGYRPDRSNPCYHVKKYKEQKRERYLAPEELACLRKALDDGEKAAVPAVAAFRLLIFTGARLSEIQTLKWSYIQGDRVFLPDSKTGAKVMLLNQPALDVLGSIKRVEKNPYVIAGREEGAYLTDLQKPWQRIRRQATVLYWRDYGDEASGELVRGLQGKTGVLPTWEDCQKEAGEAGQELPVGLTDVRIHDLRYTFASVAVMGGESLPMIGKQLGHTQPQTTDRYAHLADDPLRAGVGRIGVSLAKMMAGE